MLSPGLAIAAGALHCAALAGPTSRTAVVDSATAVQPSPGWQPAETSPYRPEPVTVPFCRVQGRIEGNIGFELWLPMAWNGRLLGAGVGGDAGVFNYRDMSFRVQEGFATVTTDTGHKTSHKRWMADRKARVDYEHRAVHLTAKTAKTLVARFYGRPVSHSYFLGCSGGGRQALKEMQKYPADYDGVIAGAPGPYMPLISVRMMWFSLQQKHNPEGALSNDDWALYERRATAACDANDGVKDGVVENPLACRFDRASLLCKPGQTSDCLTAPKLTMLNRIVRPMPDEQGRPMDKGLLPGVRTRPGPPSPLLRAMWADAVYDDPDWNEESFRRSADLDAVNRVMPELRADSTHIAPFIRRGGKAIIYQGWADPSVIARPAVDYYAALARDNDGEEALAKSVRLFMAPGMYHCAGGPGADVFGGSGHLPLPARKQDGDVLWSLIRWVERGQAPGQIVATKLEGSTVRFSRKLCPFPQAAVYDGKGDVDDAESFVCRRDPVLAKQMSSSTAN